MALARSNTDVPHVPQGQRRYTADQMRDALLKSRGLVTVAAKMLGCEPHTVHRYIRDFPTVAAALKEAREGILDMTEARLFQAANEGEQWAVTFLLKNIGKDRGYMEKQQIEQSGDVTIRVRYVDQND